MKLLLNTIILSLLIFSACSNEAEKKADSVALTQTKAKKVAPKQYVNLIEKLEPYFQKLGEPQKGEWLASFEEEGQTFEQYINSNPTLPTKQRRTIYIQPIGKFNEKQIKTIKLTAEYLGLFYNVPIKLLKIEDFKHPLSLANQRTHPQWNIKQVRTGYILDELLQPNLPEDAAALISFTTMDLYPDKNFNYLFGQASLKNRVGVWSFYRLEKDADFKLFLKRTLKIAVHETGHMFSFYHCTKFSCAMNGTNNIVESDKRPLDFCPEDTAKIVWLTEADAKKRYENLRGFCLKNGLEEEGNLYREKSSL